MRRTCRGDQEAVARLWADDLVITVPHGADGQGRRPRHVAVRADAVCALPVVGHAIRVYGDAAVVTGRIDRTRTIGDRTLDDAWRFTKVDVKRDGAWLVVEFDASEVPGGGK